MPAVKYPCANVGCLFYVVPTQEGSYRHLVISLTHPPFDHDPKPKLDAGVWNDLEPSIPNEGGEIRMTDPDTGAQKGAKDARYDLIPVGPLKELAELYGFGAKKYAARNWERGYDLSLSYAALQRHANMWWGGEDVDKETLKSHMASVAWHAFTLMQLLETHPEKDDRPHKVDVKKLSDILEPPKAFVGEDDSRAYARQQLIKQRRNAVTGIAELPLRAVFAYWNPSDFDTWEAAKDHFLTGQGEYMQDLSRKLDVDGVGFADDESMIKLSREGEVLNGHHRLVIMRDWGNQNIKITVHIP